MATIKGRITKEHVRNFLSGAPTDRHEILKGTNPRGFGLKRFKGQGNKCWFIAEARLGIRNEKGILRGNGPNRLVTIERASADGLTAAREKAESILAQLKSGIDVAEQRRVNARTDSEKHKSVREAVRDHIRSEQLAPATIKDINRLLLGEDQNGAKLPKTSRAEHISAHFMARPVISVAPTEAKEAIERLKSDSNRQKATRYLHAAIETAYGRLDCGRANPIKRAKVQRKVNTRTTHLAIHDAALLLSRLEYKNTIQSAAAILILLTGLRLTEALTLRWEDVGPDEIKIRRTKNKTDHVLPMTKPLRHLFNKLGTGEFLGDGWVFSSNRGPKGHLTTLRQSLEWATNNERFLINEIGDGINGTPTAHDLRRTVASGMMMLGVSKERVGMVLNHRSLDVTMGYIQSTSHQKLEALTLWQNALLKNAKYL